MITALVVLFMAGYCKMAIPAVIIAAGISALSNLVGQGVSSAQNKENQKARERYLKQSRDEEQSWYDRNYYADPTQRADALRLINAISEDNKNRNRAIAGRAAMGGATEEAVAQEKALNNQKEAEVISAIAADNNKRKDAIDAQHHQNVQHLNDAEFNMEQAEAARKAQNLQTAIASAGNIAASIAGNTADGADAGNTETEPVNTPGQQAPVATPPADAGGVKDSATQLSTKRKPYE